MSAHRADLHVASGDAEPRVFVATTPDLDAAWIAPGAGPGPRLERCAADALARNLDGDGAARACVIVEPPVSSLARALTAGSETSCTDHLDAWCTAARQLLQRAVAQPARCLCANVDEIRLAIPAWHEALARFLGTRALNVAAVEGLPRTTPDELDLFVAQAAVTQHREAAALFEQLLACCIVLGAHDRAPPTALAAASALRQLRIAAAGRRSTAGESPSGQVDVSPTEARETLDRLYTAQADLEASLTNQASLRRELDATRAEALQTSERLAALQGQLDAATAGQDALGRELEAARQRCLELEGQLREMQQAQDEYRATAREAADAARREGDAARREADTLLEKLHEAHEQLARHYLDARTLRSMPAILGHGSGPIVGATSVHPIGEHAEGRHRHLDVQLRDLHIGGRRRPDARVRIVEHLGRPGLVLFSEAPAGPWLSAWETSGSEGTSEYMLIVPGDEAGQAALSRFGRSDWLTIVDLAGLVLRGAVESGSERWAVVARRLCRELSAMSPRLRYDRLDVEQDGQAIRVCFGNAMFGALDWSSVNLRWLPSGRSGRLELLAGDAADSYLPLARWPVEADAPHEGWPIPVGSWATARDKRNAWSSLPEIDRSFVLALLDALPAVQGRAPAADQLAVAARAGLREAQALSRSLARRRTLRRALGRLTSR